MKRAILAILIASSIITASACKNTNETTRAVVSADRNKEVTETIVSNEYTVAEFEESKIRAINDEEKQEIIDISSDIISEEQRREKERQEIIDHLSYLKFIDGEETDVDDDQIDHIIATSEETGIDAHLISTIIYSESRGQSDVFNGNCRGYGGVGYDGARLVYEDILELGEYDHDMAFDPYMNITFIGYILDYLMYHYDYNIYQAIQYYSGTKGEQWYLNYTVRKLDQIGGPTLDEIDQEWRENYEQRG